MSLGTVGTVLVACALALCPLTWLVGQTQPAAATDSRSLPLRDQHGESMTIRSLEGRTLLLNFIFTHCVSACHTQVKSLNAVRAGLPPDVRARVQFLSISLDPSRDTPQTLREYARTMRIDDAEWRFATGSPSDIDAITRALGVKREALADGQIDHTLVVILLDAKGRLLQRYAGSEVDTARLVREVGEVVRLFDPAYQSASPGGRER